MIPRDPVLRAIAAALTLLLTACRESPAADSGRQFVAVSWDTLWTWSATDSLPLDPFRIAADARRVYLVDGLNSRAAALDARRGTLLWTAGRRGAGPGELNGPDALAAVRSGLLVSDPRNARLARLDSAGRFGEPVPLRGVFPSALCELGDGSLLVPNGFTGAPFLRVSATGTVVEEMDAPWPDLREGPASYRTVRMAATPDGGCLVALELGRGFARFHGGRFLPPHRYVEWFDLPEVTRGEHTATLADGRKVRRVSERVVGNRGAALGVAVLDTLLAVAFGGETAYRGRLIDFYDWRTGDYRYSYRTPFPAGAMTAANGNFYFLGETPEGYSTILAARPRPL